MEQRIRTAKNHYKRKVEAYTAGLIELEDLNEEKPHLEKVMEEVHQKSSISYVNIPAIEEMGNEKIKNASDAIDIIPVADAKSLLSEHQYSQ
jgi:site-specific DNA recombinase